MNIPTKYEVLLDLYDSGSLPPDEQIELAQFLIDTDLYQQLHQYTQWCECEVVTGDMILEGFCYEVVTGDS